jgi:spore maturation protein CgeB
MLDKIRYYLAHESERQQIAEAARKRVLREHTWGQRITLMTQHLEALYEK